MPTHHDCTPRDDAQCNSGEACAQQDERACMQLLLYGSHAHAWFHKYVAALVGCVTAGRAHCARMRVMRSAPLLRIYVRGFKLLSLTENRDWFVATIVSRENLSMLQPSLTTYLP